jgi:hypothetical protein
MPADNKPADQKPAATEQQPAQPPAAPPAAPPAPPPAPPAPEQPKMPAKLKMLSLYGFFDDNKRYRSWHEGDVITDPSEIQLLVERKAPIEEIA